MRTVCNKCHRQFPTDATGSSPSALKHSQNTNHQSFHYVEDIQEQHITDQNMVLPVALEIQRKYMYNDF